MLNKENKDGENLNKAGANFQHALELKDNYLEARYNLAEVYANREMLNEAIAEMARAVNIAPNDANILYELGRFVYNRSLVASLTEEEKKLDQETTEQIFKRVVELNPNHANALFSLGLIYEQKGDKNTAIDYYQKVQTSNPDNEELKKKIDSLKNTPATDPTTASE